MTGYCYRCGTTIGTEPTCLCGNCRRRQTLKTAWFSVGDLWQAIRCDPRCVGYRINRVLYWLTLAAGDEPEGETKMKIGRKERKQRSERLDMERERQLK